MNKRALANTKWFGVIVDCRCVAISRLIEPKQDKKTWFSFWLNFILNKY
jgi:hypothetical protein